MSLSMPSIISMSCMFHLLSFDHVFGPVLAAGALCVGAQSSLSSLPFCAPIVEVDGVPHLYYSFPNL